MPVAIRLPAISNDFESGNIAEWYKNEGDLVEVGDIIIDVETDKATIEVESVDAGVLAKILIPTGTEEVPVNTLIGVLLSDGEGEKELQAFLAMELSASDASDASDSAQEVEELEAVSAQPAADAKPVTIVDVGQEDPQRLFVSPLARRVADQLGVNLEGISGRGPRGRILKLDVLQAAESDSSRGEVSQKVSAEDNIVIPHSNIRKVVARRLTESKQQVPHFYLTVDCEIDALLALRKEANQQVVNGDVDYKLSLNDFIIKACALALEEVPDANASWTDDAIIKYRNVDISVAVATESGLITPVMKHANSKGIIAISNEMNALAEKARNGRLRPEEYQGGGFSISNLGMYGIKEFSAIINPPQSCILAVGAGEMRPVIKDGQVVPATVMTCTLSVDHRSVDGAVGSMFMAAFKRNIESPLKLLWRAEAGE